MMTEKQAKEFIKNYGNDDVFYSYRYNKATKAVEITYFSHLAKFFSPEAIELFIEKYEHFDYKYKHLLRTLVISDTSAYIEGSHKFTDRTLIDNYYKYREDIEELTC